MFVFYLALILMYFGQCFFELGHAFKEDLKTDVVVTSSGPIVGVTKQYEDSGVSQFLGIPFAEAPVGELRFRKPVSKEPWIDTLEATSFQPSCMQYLFENDKWLLPNLNVSEDCLHLNIFVPGNVSQDVTQRKAVMVWIHGGGFVGGQASLYDGSYLAIRGDVIVVTTNYRLGMFGFLSTEDENARGNFGLWDQVLAIKWVSDNIHAFGGDSSNICIFGESAGGYSVGLHTILPVNKGHFQRAICESGTVLSPRSIASDAKIVSERLANSLNCSTGNGTKYVIECLRLVSAEDILRVQYEAYQGIGGGRDYINRLGPVVDGDLIKFEPLYVMKDVHSEGYVFFESLDILIGSNNAEGGVVYGPLRQFQDSLHFNLSEGIPASLLDTVIAPMASRSYFNGSEVISEALRREYNGGLASNAEVARSALSIYGDLQFMIPTIRTLDYHSTAGIGSTYQYIFTHQPSYPWIQDRPPWLTGANHAGELPFVFGLEAMYPKDQDKLREEQMLSSVMMKYWSNFAKTGNPNNPKDTELLQWPMYDTSNKAFMNLSVNLMSGQYLNPDRVNFWNKVIPDIIANPWLAKVIETKSGLISGISKKYNEQWVDQYLGIPYAQPPTGDLRFRKPQPITPWQGMYFANSFQSPCMQQMLENNGHVPSEDCLHLNIFIPKTTSDKRRAVMIWIHGGAYVSGSSFVDASFLALKGDVIIVTINYRLGLFGFLSTEDEHSKGNYGLWDQVLAIKWVNENIPYFGGDSARICIFGESAGGYSVGLNTIIPENKGAFNCAIYQSGTVTSPRALAADAAVVARRTGELLNCPTDSGTETMLYCLRSKSSEEVIGIQNNAYRDIAKSLDFLNRLGPVVDGELLADTPANLLRDRNSDAYIMFNNLNIIVGSNDFDGGLFYWTLKGFQRKYDFNISDGTTREVLCDVVADASARSYFSNNDTIATSVCKFYGAGNLSFAELGKKALDIYGDLHFMIPTAQTIEQHAGSKDGGSSFHYIFTHKPSYRSDLPAWIDGASHADDVAFVFGTGHKLPDEQTLSEQIMLYWTNFAKTGNPNTGESGSRTTLTEWLPYTTGTKHYINLTLVPTDGDHLYSDRVEFWSKFIPDILFYKEEESEVNSGNVVIFSCTLLFIIGLSHLTC